MWDYLRQIFFKQDAEEIHERALQFLQLYGTLPSFPFFGANNFLPLKKWGLSFKNPVGLAAGFDKNGICIHGLQKLGFGFVEVGTVTAYAQSGNPKPRLFRLEKDSALFNRLGFNNAGAHAVAKNLEKARRKALQIPIGVNIGKTKITPLAKAPEDYAMSFRILADLADYVVINVSSPNTQGLRDLQHGAHLERLLSALAEENALRTKPKPLLLKLAPDLELKEANFAAENAISYGLSGLIISNTSTKTSNLKSEIPEGAGGVSGAPIFRASTYMLQELSKNFQDKLDLIGVGGIMNASDAKEKFRAGASLIQVYTGFVYGGPHFPRVLVESLLRPELPPKSEEAFLS